MKKIIRKEKTAKIKAFVFKKNPGQVGGGYYSLIACFPELGVHVHFTMYAHSENEYLDSLGKAVLCDGSCEEAKKRKKGKGISYNNFRREHDSDYNRTRIIEKAITFYRKLDKKK
jgi:hypothetical protein